MSIARTLVAALAVTALAVPAAQARPADMHASFAEAAAKAQQQTDFRSPDTIDAAQHARGVVQLRGHGAAKPVNAPGATAVDSATRLAPVARTHAAPPTWPADPKPITSAPAVNVVDDGVDWTPILLGIAGGLLAVCILGVLTTRRRRLRMAS